MGTHQCEGNLQTPPVATSGATAIGRPLGTDFMLQPHARFCQIFTCHVSRTCWRPVSAAPPCGQERASSRSPHLCLPRNLTQRFHAATQEGLPSGGRLQCLAARSDSCASVQRSTEGRGLHSRNKKPRTGLLALRY